MTNYIEEQIERLETELVGANEIRFSDSSRYDTIRIIEEKLHNLKCLQAQAQLIAKYMKEK